jgi:hypothetical protein
MGDSFINQVTLDCLLNKELLDKKLLNKLAKSVDKHDKKFYRKRIHNLSKELLLSKEDMKDIPVDIKFAFNNFIKVCINHFKTIDNNDIIQQEHIDYENLEKSICIGENINEINTDNILNKEDADKLLMRSININPNSLDNFVQRKSTNPQKQMIIPKQKEINLKDPALKEKGITNKCKKKNINNKYDETPNEKKEKLCNINEKEKEKE